MIQVENITKRYGNFTAVDGISFDIDEGEIVGFLGPNGAGKSTTMNMITGFIEPSDGRIIVDGYDISKKPQKAKRQIGYMPEGVPLYSDLTVKEFVAVSVVHSLIFPDISYILQALSPDCPVFNIDVTVFFLLI